MTEASKEAMEAAIAAHEASYSPQIQRQDETIRAKSPSPEKTPPPRQVPAHAEAAKNEVRRLIDTNRWPSCKMMESQGIPDLVLRTAAEKWRLSGEIPDWREVLDDIERYLGNRETNRTR